MLHTPFSWKVDQQLTQSLGFTACHLRWMPYLLSDEQKREIIQQVQLVLQKLMAQ
jgi:hypothetical protein